MYEICDSDADSDAEYNDLLQIIIFRRKRTIPVRPNHFHVYDDKDFRDRFRLTKQAAWCVLECIRPQIQQVSRNDAVMPEQMLLLTLRFYATGSFQQTIADLCGVSKSTASRIITRVSHHVALLREQFIYFPKTEQDVLRTQANFYKIAKFPRVMAALDCTHVKILSPGGDSAEIFRNRKGFFSFNVQTMCDSNLKILDIVARWPGSAHDATIFRNSKICYRIDSGELKNGVILADSGYENTRRVLTPLLNTRNSAENLYNESHIRTKNCVERSYGVWKRRFPLLSLGIRMNKKKIQSIIVATAVLHNVCCIYFDKSAPMLPPEVNEAIVNVLNVPPNRDNGAVSQKDQVRRSFIDNYFSRL